MNEQKHPAVELLQGVEQMLNLANRKGAYELPESAKAISLLTKLTQEVRKLIDENINLSGVSRLSSDHVGTTPKTPKPRKGGEE